MSSPGSKQRRTYHIPFASRLLNTFGPNQLYPELGLRWSDEEWFRHLEMVQGFGFNAFQIALEPRVFSPEAHQTEYGKAFRRQMAAVTAHARSLGMDTCLLAPLAGSSPRQLCPGDAGDWATIKTLWGTWLGLLPDVTVVGVAPGAGCQSGGCTARTFVDRSLDLADLVASQLPKAVFELHTWGPPFLGWGTRGWKADRARTDDALGCLVKKLPELGPGATVAVNLGFGPEGEPDEAASAWAHEIAKHARIVSWDPGLTDPDDPVLPRYGLERLCARRRAEAALPYSGGLHCTTSPLLNQVGSFASARSFLSPEDNGSETARAFLQGIFGTQGRAVAESLPLFDARAVLPPRAALRKTMAGLFELLSSLKARSHGPFHPEPEGWRKELVFFARLARDLSDPSPDYDELHQRYWYHVYRIHDRHPDGVDPHPAEMARRLIERFKSLPA